MSKIICSQCMKVHDLLDDNHCPSCQTSEDYHYDFSNSDSYLKKEVPRIIEERKNLGLDGLVEGLDSVIINTEPHLQKKAADEFMKTTGFHFSESFKDEQFSTIVLELKNSASLLIRSRNESRSDENNPFIKYNIHPKSKHLPNTRLETFVFNTPDIETYIQIQKERGVRFLTSESIKGDSYSFIQTIPSKYTGNSIGFIQWDTSKKSYRLPSSNQLNVSLQKPDAPHLKHIMELDHTATRVRATDRDAAIVEFMELTNYNFDFAIYVKLFNSITNVARLSADDFAMVFTSGVTPYKNDEESGPTEKFIHNYGTRVHHLAFHTENIEYTFNQLKQQQMKFLIDLVGSEKDGLKQTFTEPSTSSLLVNEYIHRYGDFDGFFTRSNVTRLTESTKKQ